MTTLYWGRGGDTWEPEGGQRVKIRDLKPGDMIALERALWRLIEVRDVPVADWDDNDQHYYDAHTDPADRTAAYRQVPRRADGTRIPPGEWNLRPVNLIVEPAKGGKRRHLRCRPYVMLTSLYVIPEHHPVCSACGELYPCRHLDMEAETAKQMAKFTKYESILPGCCWSCGNPVTERQKSIAFEGENLLRPGGPPVVFHLRKGSPYCSSAAYSYDKRWIEAAPDRHPRLFCPGNVVVHVDGPECSEDPYCPGPRMNHQSYWNHRVDREGLAGCLRCKDAAGRGESAAADPADGTEHLW